jgi:hypothetical protein
MKSVKVNFIFDKMKHNYENTKKGFLYCLYILDNYESCFFEKLNINFVSKLFIIMTIICFRIAKLDKYLIQMT